MPVKHKCGICSEIITTRSYAIQCNSSCKRWHHSECIGMDKTKVQEYIKECKNANSTRWVCDTCKKEDSVTLLDLKCTPDDNMENWSEDFETEKENDFNAQNSCDIMESDSYKMEITYLKKLLEHKDIIIKNMDDKIQLLVKQIELLNKLNASSVCLLPNGNTHRNTTAASTSDENKSLPVSKSNTNGIKMQNSKQTTKPDIQQNNIQSNVVKRNTHNGQKNEAITLPQVQKALLETQTSLKMNEVIKLANATESTIGEKVEKIKIVGSDNSINVAANVKTWLYVSKYKTTYSKDDLENYLKSKYPNSTFICKPVKTWGISNSFRVAVDLELKDQLLDGSKWPSGIEVSEYIFRSGNYKHSRQKKSFSRADYQQITR